jgi:uncharacterized membrane protein
MAVPVRQMIWIKSALVGFLAAFFTIVAIVIATAAWSVTTTEGGGGVSFLSFGVSGLLLIPFVLAFVLAFRWMFRRQQRRNIAHQRPT